MSLRTLFDLSSGPFALALVVLVYAGIAISFTAKDGQ